MFNNVGGKIKTVAKGLFCLGLILSVLIAIKNSQGASTIFDYDSETFFSVLTLIYFIVGFFFSWVSSLILYGFGELIEKATEIANNTQSKVNYLANGISSSIKSDSTRSYLNPNYVNTVCPCCLEEVAVSKSEIKDDTALCPLCKEEFKFSKK